MTDDVLLVIGTRKGLFVARSRAGAPFEVGPIQFSTIGVPSVAIDTRGGSVRLLAGIEYGHFGPSVMWSDDLGSTWEEAGKAPVAFPPATDATLTRVWQLQPSPVEPDVVWAGAEPAALFRSEDRGQTFTLTQGLWDHPHRLHWRPGGGGLCLHSIVQSPADPAVLAVATSTGGFYRSTDAGRTWEVANTGIRAPFLPEGQQYPEFGQCVHRIGGHPSRLFLQHHFGVYRSDDFGSTWTSIGDSLPSDFGFPLVVHPRHPDTLYVFPLVGDVNRVPVDHRYHVYRSTDAGESWTALSEGLPTDTVYASVLRDAMSSDGADPAGVYFGTRDGEVYGSRDEGDTWSLIARHLPDVLSVRAAVQ